ncbi:MAG: ferrous iron transport protein A [Lachnospiraceae bacterium]|nr:ferrous iron transport protein A [Lachnospiraceae bacterium]
MQSLTEMPDNAICTIKWMLGLPEEMDQALRSWEIHPGSEIRVIQNNGDGLMIIGSGARRIAMNAETTDHIRV